MGDFRRFLFLLSVISGIESNRNSVYDDDDDD